MDVSLYKYDYANFDTNLAQKKLFEKHSVGRYVDVDIIKKIFKLLFDIYSQELDQLIKEYGGMELLDITLFQHNKSVVLQKQGGGVGIVKDTHPIVWKQMYKYILELIIKYQKNLPKSTKIDNKTINQIFCLADEIFLLANSIANLRFYNAGRRIELIPENKIGTTFMNYGNNPAFSCWFFDKLSKNLELYTTKYNKKFTQYDKEFQYPFLNDIFLSSFGFTYEKYLSTCTTFFHETSLDTFPNTYLGNKHIKKSDLIKMLKLGGLEEKQIILIVSSISLNNKNVEYREIYRPDDDYRLYARFLIEAEYEGDTRYFWDPLLAKDSFGMIMGNFMIGKIPRELDTPNINDAVQKMRNKYNKSFEEVVSDQLGKTDYSGKRWKENEIFSKELTLILPSTIGEIDRIGIDAKKQNIMLYEFKTNKLAAIDIQFANEIQKFTDYGDKFVKKINWVKENIEEIKKGLGLTYGIEDKGLNFKSTMITEKPTAYAYFEKRFVVEDFCETFENLEKE